MIKSINSIMTWLITIFVIVITIIISSINIYTIMDSNNKSLDIYRKEVYNNNKDMITYETQIATNIVHQFYEKELSGEYTREEAMYKAANAIRNLKYGDGGYFFIGHSETINKNETQFNYLKPAMYRRGGDK